MRNPSSARCNDAAPKEVQGRSSARGRRSHLKERPRDGTVVETSDDCIPHVPQPWGAQSYKATHKDGDGNYTTQMALTFWLVRRQEGVAVTVGMCRWVL